MSGYGGVGGGAGPASGLLGAILDRAQDTLFALASCVPCGPSSSTLKLNGRTFKIVKLLGEGGFSFVYLAQDAESGRYFALKKVSVERDHRMEQPAGQLYADLRFMRHDRFAVHTAQKVSLKR